ncbi:hypothetical protein KJ359_012201 [Pestalotiopsis sp. 9143b]|nr:hypothetical protein KJ359_012201 [Pestalotiopsis sp. 9143b]
METTQSHIDFVDQASETAPSTGFHHSLSRSLSPSTTAAIESLGHDKRTNGLTANIITLQRRDAPVRGPLRSSRGGGSSGSIAETDKSESQTCDSSSSDGYDDGSHLFGGKSLEDTRKHWEILNTQRLQVRGLLDELRKERANMKALAQMKDDADRDLEIAIRKDPLGSNRDTLEPYLVAIRTSRLKYQAAETIVDQLIENVDDATFEADILEKRFYSRLGRQNLAENVPGAIDETQSQEKAPSRMSLRGISPDRFEDIHPSYERLREVYGDLQLAREYYNNLTIKKAVLESEDRDVLGAYELEFLDDFEDSLEQAKVDVQASAWKFEQLRGECAAKGLIPQSSPFFEDDFFGGHHKAHYSGAEDISFDEHLVDEGTLSHHRYPLLVTNPKHVLNSPPLTSKGALREALMLPPTTSGRNQEIQEAMHEHSIATLLQDANPEDKNDYINRWLLQKLRISPMEVEILSLTFRKILKILDYERWQRDVLRFWSQDIKTESTQHSSSAPLDRNKHGAATISNPSDKRDESRSETITQAVSEPALERVNSYDDWEYLDHLHDGAQSEGAL